MESSVVSALLDGIAAMRQSLRDDNASTLHIDGALALQQCAQIIERTTLLAGELTAREQNLVRTRRRTTIPRRRGSGRAIGVNACEQLCERWRRGYHQLDGTRLQTVWQACDERAQPRGGVRGIRKRTLAL